MQWCGQRAEHGPLLHAVAWACRMGMSHGHVPDMGLVEPTKPATRPSWSQTRPRSLLQAVVAAARHTRRGLQRVGEDEAEGSTCRPKWEGWGRAAPKGDRADGNNSWQQVGALNRSSPAAVRPGPPAGHATRPSARRKTPRRVTRCLADSDARRAGRSQPQPACHSATALVAPDLRDARPPAPSRPLPPPGRSSRALRRRLRQRRHGDRPKQPRQLRRRARDARGVRAGRGLWAPRAGGLCHAHCGGGGGSRRRGASA
eukprot:358897-Chlamydomonas_euryale.AAC.14